MGITYAVVLVVRDPPAGFTGALASAVEHLRQNRSGFPELHADLRVRTRKGRTFVYAEGFWYKGDPGLRGHISRVLGRRGLTGKISIVKVGEPTRFSGFQPRARAWGFGNRPLTPCGTNEPSP